MDPHFLEKLLNMQLDPMNAMYLMHKMILNISSDAELTMRLDPDTTITISVDRAVRIENTHTGVILAMNTNGCCTALVHPFLRLDQNGSKIELEAYDWHGRDSHIYDRHAKMGQRGVTFCWGVQPTRFAYLVDRGGPRTTHEKFNTLSTADITIPMYRAKSRVGAQFMPLACALATEAMYQLLEDASDKWIINGVEVTFYKSGEVCINRGNGLHMKMWLNTEKAGTVMIKNDFMHLTVSTGDQAHFFVRQNDMRIHHNGALFNVRNAGYCVTLDEDNNFSLL